MPASPAASSADEAADGGWVHAPRAVGARGGLEAQRSELGFGEMEAQSPGSRRAFAPSRRAFAAGLEGSQRDEQGGGEMEGAAYEQPRQHRVLG